MLANLRWASLQPWEIQSYLVNHAENKDKPNTGCRNLHDLKEISLMLFLCKSFQNIHNEVSDQSAI